MLGCGQCERCRRGRQHICHHRYEIGVLGGWDGAVAEQLLVPVTALHALPDTVTDTAGAMVEPGANSRRAAEAAVAGSGPGSGPGLGSGSRVAVFGPGTIGLLAAAFAASLGAEVHVIGRSAPGLELARALGLTAWSSGDLPTLRFDAVIDATNSAEIPRMAVDLVEAGGRIICVGLAGQPSLIDTRTLVVNDLTVQGHLSGSPAMAATITSYADGSVDPTPLVAATVGLDRAADVIAGWRPADAGPGPKMHIDPRV